MGIMEIIRARHSVREYDGRPIEGETLAALQAVVDGCARESGLDIQLVRDNPEAFQVVARFGLIHGARDSVAFVTSGNESDEAIGFWGQKIVLEAQRLGLNTCWVAMCSRRKSKAKRANGQKVRLVIAIGYGRTQGAPRKTKSADELVVMKCRETPEWFTVAVEAAQLAPTAMNNQNFRIVLREDGKTVGITAPNGGWNMVDLGIVKRNFQEAADELSADWRWDE